MNGIVPRRRSSPAGTQSRWSRSWANVSGLPVLLENDANAAALGENRFGAGRGTRFMVYLTISTGVGGGIIIDGGVYHGATGSAGELGHMVVWFNGPRCLCGERGCLEAIASGTGLAWRAQDLVDRGEAPGLARILREKGELDADEVADAARAGDEHARRLFDEAGLYLGVGARQPTSTSSTPR